MKQVVPYSYEPYGKIKSIIGREAQSLGNINPFLFKGYYYDNEVNLYYLSSRYYDPEIGRFITPDSTDYLDSSSINGLNLFAYCWNDPINKVDPSGNSVILAMLIGAGIDLTIGLVSQLVSDTISNITTKGFNFSEWEASPWQTYVWAGLGGAIGGVLTPFLGPTATGFISGVLSSFLSMGLSDITGMSSYSLSTIVGTSLLIGFACGMTAGLIDNLKMPGINSGRGSLSAISKQINTKFINGTIKHISLTTFEKTALLIAVYSTPFAFFMDFLLMGLFCAKIIREAI